MIRVLMVVRLNDIGFPLLALAAEWCPFEQEPTYGFLLKNDDISKNQERDAAEPTISVAYVHPRLPVALAGLVPGDRIISVNTREVVRMTVEEIS